MIDLSKNVDPSGPPAPPDPRIKLLVGDRLFTTTKRTLVIESAYFASLLSGKWGDRLPDGSYFIDADPVLFEHLLRYLRHGIFPLFYDQARGHDLGLYAALRGEANYFGVARLHKWLLEGKYLHAVQLRHTVDVIEAWKGHDVTTDSGTTAQLYPKWRVRKVYVCPRGIPVHWGDPSRCGRQCQNARGDDPTEYDEEDYLSVAVVKQEVMFRFDVCMPEEDDAA